MKKILVSVAAAAIALSTTASALEDIKVNGQAKLWYETDNQGEKPVKDRSLFNQDSASGEVVFKLGMTGKQGDVGFGATLYQGTTMGLENDVVSDVRTRANNAVNSGQDGFTDASAHRPFFGELYFTAPIAPDTVLKFGKQELDTPLAFTERWNAMPNTFDAAVAINSSIENVTLIAAFIGQGNGGSDTFELNAGNAGIVTKYVNGTFKAGDEFDSYYGGAYALAALYKNDAMTANFWAYYINDAIESTVPTLTQKVDAYAAWLDVGMKAGDVNVKGYLAYMDHTASSELAKALDKKTDGVNGDATFAAALSADISVSDIKIFGAASYVNEGDLPVANTATGYKKTMLPTQGIYTDGQYVAQPGSMAFKLSAATKLADTALSLNVVNNTNSGSKDQVMGINGFKAQTLETTEVYATVSQKVGAFDLMGIVMHRDMNDSATDKSVGGQYVRVVASVNF
ncbi:MAG: hypothetical protein RBR59_03260 [Sulfurimonadaceae bacterium]|jgi:antitoxin component YwqK of YwqJK toxin-antitoxin module|nr:hypothetical protein [Sulfurimonadaceae bacterium]